MIFVSRWNAIGWPRKIIEHIESTENQLDDDEKKFQKNLQNDQTNFEDRLDTLEVLYTVHVHVYMFMYTHGHNNYYVHVLYM